MNTMLKKILRKVFGIIWLIRIPIVSVSILLSTTALHYSGIYVYSGLLPLTCIIIAGYIQNDIFDLRIDMIAAPSRPIPSGMVSLQEAKILYSLFVGLGLISGITLNNILFLVYLIVVLVFFFVYTKYCKSNWLLKNLFTAITSTSVIFIPLFYGGRITRDSILLGFTAFFFTLGREIFMDIRDQKGDQIIPRVKRIHNTPAFILSFVFLLISRIVAEYLLHTSLYRYLSYVIIFFVFFNLFKGKKSNYWIGSEMMKIIFIIDLSLMCFLS